MAILSDLFNITLSNSFLQRKNPRRKLDRVIKGY